MRKTVAILLGIILLTACLPAFAQPAAKSTPNTLLPITTRSPQARKLFHDALAEWEDTLKTDHALSMWRKSVQLDPNFAMAHIMIAYVSADPGEQIAQRRKAQALLQRASKGEQLVIEWMGNAGDHRFVDAIAAMNEVVAKYPHDERLSWLAGHWLVHQREHERAIPLFERAKVAGSWNELGYCYATMRDWDKSFAAMQKYIEALPNEPNPHDSYAELSRMAGRFDDALKHFNEALKIDPKFANSQMGIADTYALMGDQERARKEYARVAEIATTPNQRVLANIRAGISYVRENNFEAADKTLRDAAAEAHAANLGIPEAEAYRIMGLYQKEPAAGLESLSKAGAVLEEKHQLSRAAHEQELSAVLYARVLRGIDAGKTEIVDSVIKQLEWMASSSQDPAVMRAYHGAAGAFAASQSKWEDAVAHLEEDDRNPYSLRTLISAYQKMGNEAGTKRATATLTTIFVPTIEQALVVPAFRSEQEKLASTPAAAPSQ